MFDMCGHLVGTDGALIMRGGFMPAHVPPGGFSAGFNNYNLNRAEIAGLSRSEETTKDFAALQRGEYDGDVNALLAKMGVEIADLQRGITSGATAFPVRENLEAVVSVLVPQETPLRNLLPRVPGAGAAGSWRQLTSLGGGWGSGYDQGGGGSVIRMFYAEAGAPAEHTSAYATKTAPYKLLGTLGSVTGFAMAAGANFQAQLPTEKTNQINNLMLNEELALLQGSSTATAAPWGDGTNALAFDGLMTLTSTANGTPSAQVQTAVGALTTGHIDAQLNRLVKNGYRGLYMILNIQEAASLAFLLQATGSVQRLQIADRSRAALGFQVAQYFPSAGGAPADVFVDLFQNAGEILYGSRFLPTGTPSAVVEVLPQVPVELAPEKPQQIQGYASVDLSRSLTQPDVHPFMISSYEVLKMHSALGFAKSTGVTPAV